MSSPSDSFDYIIIGAGSAGCVLAARLSEDSAANVLLLEAGGTDQHDGVIDPRLWPTLFKSELEWGYFTEPLKHCNNRRDHVPRGKMLGGCHSVNANIWARGHPSDFDAWAAAGCPGWSWADVLPIFQKIEDWHGPPSPLRGTGGPLFVSLPVDPNPLAAAFNAAGPSVGIPIVEDHNGPSMEGVGYVNLTVKDGKRFSVADGYLRPAMSRPNLTVRTNAETHKLLIENGRCVGIEYLQGGTMLVARAANEVILSAGAIGSPKLLLLSGIGPADELKSLGIPVVANLAGVGKNLQDHLIFGSINYEGKGPLPPVRNNGVESTLWWKSDSRLPTPDIQPVFHEFPYATPELAGMLPSMNCYGIAPSVVRTASRGSVTLASSDPSLPPRIDPNFLAEDADLKAILAAVDLCRAMGASAAFDEFRGREVMPGPLGRNEMIAFARNAATTYFHPTSTCSMGTGANAVVDPQLRVHGVAGLRVADASIMPRITTGNTNAPTVMIGEKAAAMILGRKG